jgi:hypothetical protein
VVVEGPLVAVKSPSVRSVAVIPPDLTPPIYRVPHVDPEPPSVIVRCGASGNGYGEYQTGEVYARLVTVIGT